MSLEEVKRQKMFLVVGPKQFVKAIVNYLGDHFIKKLKSNMQEMPYSLMLDCSSDTGLSKMFPIAVRVFDVSLTE